MPPNEPVSSHAKSQQIMPVELRYPSIIVGHDSRQIDISRILCNFFFFSSIECRTKRYSYNLRTRKAAPSPQRACCFCLCTHDELYIPNYALFRSCGMQSTPEKETFLKVLPGRTGAQVRTHFQQLRDQTRAMRIILIFFLTGKLRGKSCGGTMIERSSPRIFGIKALRSRSISISF